MTREEMPGSRHWLGVLVNTWIAVAPITLPLTGAFSTPPWTDTWAPKRSAEIHADAFAPLST